MSEISNIRKLLSDPNLGLFPQIDKTIKDIQTNFSEYKETFHFEHYDLELGTCHSQVTPNDARPIIAQSLVMKFPIIGLTKDKFELLMLAAEIQNNLDATIMDWSTRERSQYDNKPLRRPITAVSGKIDFQTVDKPSNSCCVTIYREFELTYAASF
ncbi:hypothetical protein [Floridanema evergladense]|uniref:Uncharacterized protein n=1 Tax=Floridaenema evergladense BLCC-F167 TaxID=3153639 RepID=A0ABV4WVF4_9CYAN